MRAPVAILAMLGLAFAARADYPAVVPGGGLAFPADEGAHPEYRTEWWYVTGWLAGPNGKPLGFQVTFFRSRPAADDANPSAFAARQVLIGHAALSDPALGHALHAERIARAGFGLADAGIGATAVSVGGWQLAAQGDSFVTAVTAADFAFRLNLARTGPPVANGQGGYSQKGPAPASASRYYSIPGLRVTGEIVRSGHRERVTGEAWLDHEWSSAYLDADSVGWDWIGLNLADGGSLMAFRIRDRAGNARWAGGTLRRPGGAIEVFAPADIGLRPLRVWRSPHTAISWPVAVGIRAGALDFTLQPLLDDQESDSRLTTGAVYWEGAVEARAGGRTIGRGYLELTGYGEPLRLR